MPVWHEKTRPYRESGELVVIGISQEQHPDRCRLYAQWQGFDWPILWDPFNLTASKAVPRVLAVDEAGIVRGDRFDPRRFEEQFVAGFLRAQSEPSAAEPRSSTPARPLPDVRPPSHERPAGSDPPDAAQHAISRLLFGVAPTEPALDGPGFADCLATLARAAAADGAAPAQLFHHGVALRMRYDSTHQRAGDFQGALDAWLGALVRDPSQYIWRRRIQQWGPRLDKPYPFYDWVAGATEELLARDARPHALRVPLCGAEIATPTKRIPSRQAEDTHPDPRRQVPRDDARLAQVETAFALHTGLTSKRVREPDGSSRIHLVLRPSKMHSAHFDPQAGPAQVWVEVPDGWDTPRQLLTVPVQGTPGEGVRVEFEVRPPTFDARNPPTGPYLPAAVVGTAFYFVCSGADGECRYLAQDFRVELRAPARGGDSGDEPDGEERSGGEAREDH